MKQTLARMGVRIDGPLSDFEQLAQVSRVDIKNTAAVLVTGSAAAGRRRSLRARLQMSRRDSDIITATKKLSHLPD